MIPNLIIHRLVSPGLYAVSLLDETVLVASCVVKCHVEQSVGRAVILLAIGSLRKKHVMSGCTIYDGRE